MRSSAWALSVEHFRHSSTTVANQDVYAAELVYSFVDGTYAVCLTCHISDNGDGIVQLCHLNVQEVIVSKAKKEREKTTHLFQRLGLALLVTME